MIYNQSNQSNHVEDLHLPSLGITDDSTRIESEEKRLGKAIARNEAQEALPAVTIVKPVVVSSQKPASTALALLKPTTTEAVFKNQWLPHCSEGAESRSRIHEIYQVKPNPDIMQTFEAARTALEEAKPNEPLKTLFLFFGTTAEKAATILEQGFTFSHPIALYTDPIQAIPFCENKELFCCRVVLGSKDLHYAVSPDGGKYTVKFGKHIIATYVFKLN